MAPHRTSIIAAFLTAITLCSSISIKTNARPVFEIINEQARMDDTARLVGNLPYGNPLAGNSKQNARIHAQNQQAMYNAEKMRQHRAQLMRWTKAPPQVDSYMKAYHESQESHQLALEQQQAKQRDAPITIPKRTQESEFKPSQKIESPSLRPDMLRQRPKPEIQVQRGERPIQRQERPVQRLEVQRPNQRGEAVIQKQERPVQRLEANVQRLERPSQRGEANIQRIERPMQRGELNIQRPERPIQRGESNMQRSERPIQRGESNIQRPERLIQRPEMTNKRLERPNQREKKIQRQERPIQRSERPIMRSGRPSKIQEPIMMERIRNHRSYGSSHQQYLQKRYQSVYLSPGPTYDQGVTIKPNGNAGLTTKQEEKETKLYTEAIPSKTRYVYPKQYNQMQDYHSAQDIDTLRSLLKKPPQEQLLDFKALMDSGSDKELETPIDLYFYTKDPAVETLPQHYESTAFAQIPQEYASAYRQHLPEKDFTPIKEDIDDIEDPNKHKNEPIHQPVETTTTKSNNYYKVEVASQTISTGYKPQSHLKNYYLKPDETPYQFSYPQNAQLYSPKEQDDSDKYTYLHHNHDFQGVQHLTGDGTEVSAYGDENLHYASSYEFGYRVRDDHSGNHFGHQERKDGEKTDGQYHVLLPDGRMQNVRYSAGPGGFHADISYDHLQELQ